MRLWLTAIAMSLALPAFPAPATAQFLDSHLDAQRHNNLRRHQQRIAKKRADARCAMTPHQRACARRYRSYDPRTDRYTVRPGVTARCRLNGEN